MKVFLHVITPDDFKTLYKHSGGNGPTGTRVQQIESEREGEEGFHELVLDDTAGITQKHMKQLHNIVDFQPH